MGSLLMSPSARMNELDQLKRFVLCVYEFIEQLSGAHMDLAAAAAIEASSSLPGLRAASSDMIECTQDFDGGMLAQLEERLASQNLPSLALMRSRQGRLIAEIVARGEIRSEDECRLILSVLSDVDSLILSGTNREIAEQLVADFNGR